MPSGVVAMICGSVVRLDAKSPPQLDDAFGVIMVETFDHGRRRVCVRGALDGEPIVANHHSAFELAMQLGVPAQTR